MTKANSPNGPLVGITIFDASVAGVGPWAATLLGALGADVIKVEHNRSDAMHNVPPMQKGLSAVYSICNFNKRCIDLNLKDKKHLAAAYELIRDADVFMENMSPGTAERLGLSYETLSRINPKLVYAHSTPWGPSGPMARLSGSDGPMQAFSGWASLNGPVGRGWEMYRYWGQADINASMYFLMSILQGLLRRAQTGQGLLVETSMLGAAVHAEATRIAEFLATGKNPVSLGSAAATTVPHQAFRCLDEKYVAVGVVREEQWPALCRAIGAEDLLADQRFATNAGRVEHREELIPRLEGIFKQKPTRWWDIRLSQFKVPFGHFLGVTDCFTNTQYRDNDVLVEVDLPHQGKINAGNLPWRLSETPVGYKPAAYPGEHTEEVLREHKIDPATLEPLPERHRRQESPRPIDRAGHARQEVGAPPGVLVGCRVIELAQGLCGPFAGSLLADMGAEVVKIEPPQGDCARGYGPPFYEGGVSAVFAMINRGKKSVTLDLDTPSGKEALIDLLASADVVIEDLGPGAADAAGYGYGTLKRANPRLVYCAITPFGDKGPFADKPGCELAVQAMATACGTLGRPEDPPERLGVDIGNVNTAAAAVQGILAALYHRGASGLGQRVDVNMLTTLVHMRGLMWAAQSNPDAWIGWQCEAYTRPPDFGWMTKDRPIYFGLRRGKDEDYFKLLISLNLEHYITDPRFQGGGRDATGHGQFSHEVVHVWEKGLSSLTAEDACALINSHNGEGVPFNNHQTLLAHPQLKVLDILHVVDHPEAGRITAITPHWSIGGIRPKVGTPAPALGQHTGEVLGNLERQAGSRRSE